MRIQLIPTNMWRQDDASDNSRVSGVCRVGYSCVYPSCPYPSTPTGSCYRCVATHAGKPGKPTKTHHRYNLVQLGTNHTHHFTEFPTNCAISLPFTGKAWQGTTVRHIAHTLPLAHPTIAQAAPWTNIVPLQWWLGASRAGNLGRKPKACPAFGFWSDAVGNC